MRIFLGFVLRLLKHWRGLADISSKIPKIGSSYFMLYSAKLHLDFRVDTYFLQDAQGIRSIYYL